MNPVSAGNGGGRRFGAAQSIVLSMIALSLLAALAWAFARPNRTRAQSSAGPATRDVPRSGNLQQALDAANPGDTILLETGATYTGNFLLRAKEGDAEITIASRASDALPEGVRVTAAESRFMPKLVTPNAEPVLRTEDRAHGYRFIGVEFTVGAGVYVYDLISLGSGTTKDPDSLAYNLDFDRVFVHGDPARGGKRGIALNSRSTMIRNSYFTDFVSKDQETQDICGWNGPGPFVILNNRLEAGGMSVMFGGSAPPIRNMVPADIVFYNNYVTRPMSWYGNWQVKNMFELKNARNVDVQYNVFENNWVSAQNGFAILFTVRTCDPPQDYPWSVVRDVNFSHNIVRKSENGVNILGQDDGRSSCRTPAAGQVTVQGTRVSGRGTAFTAHLKPGYSLVVDNSIRAIKEIVDDQVLILASALPADASTPAGFSYIAPAGQTSNVTISDNLFDSIRRFDGTGGGTFLMINSGARNISIEHNTVFQGQHILYGVGTPSPGLIFRDNISPHNDYGIFGDGKGSGTAALKSYFPDARVANNVIYGQSANAGIYPPGNFFPTRIEAVGFADVAKKKYALIGKNKFKRAGTDQRGPGADIGLLDLVEADVVSGRSPQAGALQSAVTRALQAVQRNPKTSEGRGTAR